MPPVVILCGGRGTRLRERTESIPKALVEIGGRPILWHIMKIYASFGCRRFILCLGYKGDQIRRCFTGRRGAVPRLATVSSARGSLGTPPPDEVQGGSARGAVGMEDTVEHREAGQTWTITFADTGVDTNSGGRLARIVPRLEASLAFVTYGDGLARIDLEELLAFHESHRRLATVTCVRPACPFGVVEVGGEDQVTAFREKPPMRDWVNGGFFVFDRQALDGFGDDEVLEREPLERLTRAGQLSAYRFDGFWMCMDTYKDAQQLNVLWERGEAPWKIW
ncbi:MAG: NTP transferase domain-containing protein [Candidatus Omnitrophica bacterium]|nr:NTP transferase domain-containing protein [Candidatus Omnitrophota bacterium]